MTSRSDAGRPGLDGDHTNGNDLGQGAEAMSPRRTSQTKRSNRRGAAGAELERAEHAADSLTAELRAFHSANAQIGLENALLEHALRRLQRPGAGSPASVFYPWQRLSHCVRSFVLRSSSLRAFFASA